MIIKSGTEVLEIDIDDHGILSIISPQRNSWSRCEFLLSLSEMKKLKQEVDYYLEDFK